MRKKELPVCDAEDWHVLREFLHFMPWQLGGRMDDRLSREASPGEASSLWAVTYMLLLANASSGPTAGS